MLPAYRVFRISKRGLPATLFHAWKATGRKELPLDQPLAAHIAPVTNPGGGRVFDSGWHVVLTPEAMGEYLKRFKPDQNLVACRVLVEGVRSKPGSKVLLADVMQIDSDHWRSACPEYAVAI